MIFIGIEDKAVELAKEIVRDQLGSTLFGALGIGSSSSAEFYSADEASLVLDGCSAKIFRKSFSNPDKLICEYDKKISDEKRTWKKISCFITETNRVADFIKEEAAAGIELGNIIYNLRSLIEESNFDSVRNYNLNSTLEFMHTITAKQGNYNYKLQMMLFELAKEQAFVESASKFTDYLRKTKDNKAEKYGLLLSRVKEYITVLDDAEVLLSDALLSVKYLCRHAKSAIHDADNFTENDGL